MKVTSVVAFLAAIVAVNAAAVDITPNAKYVALDKRDCGAAGSCNGAGGSDLCNDRCKRCSGPTGNYARGDCCGFAWQACCCYYS